MPSPTLDMVLQIYPLYVTGDFSTLYGILAPDFRISETTVAPWGGTYVGHSGVGQFWFNLCQHFQLTVHIEQAIECGNDIVTSGLLAGQSRLIKKEVSVPFVHVWNVKEMLVRSFTSYLDEPALRVAFPQRRVELSAGEG